MRAIVTTNLSALRAFSKAVDLAMWPNGPPDPITVRYADILVHPNGEQFAYPIDDMLEGILAWQKPDSDGTASRQSPMTFEAQASAAVPTQALYNFTTDLDGQELSPWDSATVYLPS